MAAATFLQGEVMRAIKFIRKILRRLKKRYGLPVTFRNHTSTNDLESGVITRVTVEQSVRRCIVLNSEEARDFAYDLSYIAANKDFTYGGFFDTSKRLMIVDVKDLNTLELDMNSEVVYNGLLYRMVKLERSEDNKSYYMLVENLSTETVP